MTSHAERLEAAIRAAGVPVVGVSIGRVGQPATVGVSPPEMQAAAQPTIDTFDWSAAAQAAWEEDRQPERKAVRQAASQAVADIDAYLAAADTGTAAQQAARDHAAVKRLAQITRAVVRRLAQID